MVVLGVKLLIKELYVKSEYPKIESIVHQITDILNSITKIFQGKCKHQWIDLRMQDKILDFS